MQRTEGNENFTRRRRVRRNTRLGSTLLKVAGVCFAAILVVLFLNWLYLQDGQNRYHELDKFGWIGEGYEPSYLSNVGSSHGAYGLDYSEIEAQGLRCFNFALPSQMFDQDLAVLQQFQEGLAPGGVMLIPISYFSFNDETVTEVEREGRATRYYQFVDPEYIPDYDWFVDLTTHRMPVLSGGYKLLLVPSHIIEQKKADREAEEARLSLHVLAAESEESAETADAEAENSDAEAAQESEEPDEFEQVGWDRFVRHFENKPDYFLPEREQQLRDLIAFCREKEVTPVLITMPFHRAYTDLIHEDFLETFDQEVDRIAQETGTNYYNYGMDERFSDNRALFGNADHLNEEGALYFTQLICSEIPEIREMLEQHGITP